MSHNSAPSNPDDGFGHRTMSALRRLSEPLTSQKPDDGEAPVDQGELAGPIARHDASSEDDGLWAGLG